MANISDNRCRVAVTVEELTALCPCTPKIFTVEIRNTSGEVVARGQVAGGNSAVFALPCNGVYAVTVIGDRNSSPRSQTRRVRCCCGEANGLTFIFTVYEPVCSQIVDTSCGNSCGCCPPPCPPPCCPPPCGKDPCGKCDACCDMCEPGEECYELTISHC